MIRHMVMFKIKDQDRKEEKQRIIGEIRQRLEALPIKIPEILFFNIGVNINETPSGFDLILESEFEDMEALENYRNHPAHLAFVDFFQPYRQQTASVDYEV